MSSQNKLFIFLLLPLFLAGCGFQPLYGRQGDIAGNENIMAGVKIDPIAGGRMGQQLKSDLEDRLNPSGAVPDRPAYRLNATVTSTVSAIGVARDGTVSRYNVYLDSKYTLYRNSDGREVTRGEIRHVSSYNNVTNAYFSTYVSEADAIKRGVTELSEIYRQRLAAYLTQPALPWEKQ